MLSFRQVVRIFLCTIPLGAIGSFHASSARADESAPTATVSAVTDLAAVRARAKSADYEQARWDPLHFKPAIDQASDETCLVCHSEIGTAKPRAVSPAGVKAKDTLAWYQTLDTYAGDQQDFHWRHTQSPYARQVMQLRCNFCHQGNDPREESPHVTAQTADGAAVSDWNHGAPAFALRKMVNPSETCLRCHGSFPGQTMGIPLSWPQFREPLEAGPIKNGCMTCHAAIRTTRHQVNYLHPEAIETAAKDSSDVCYGCHGGRAWYRISYPYPRHAWPGQTDVPDWARNRPTESDGRFRSTPPSQAKTP